MLKIVIAGYGEMFTNIILGSIESGHNVVGVFRHDHVLHSPTKLFFKDIFNPSKEKLFINSQNLYEIIAPSINSEKFKNEIIKLNADIIIVASWSEKLKRATINLPKIASINCHPSLLPKYRGPNPYSRTIMAGESKTGITFHLMDEKFDTGAILHQKEIPIMPFDNGNTLKLRCAGTARNEIKTLLTNITSDIIIPIPQDEKRATYQPQLDEKDILIDFNQPAEVIDRKIRGLTPWMKCYIPHKNDFFEVYDYKIINNNTNIKTAAKIIDKTKENITISCNDGKAIEFIKPKIFETLFPVSTRAYIKFKVNIGDDAN